LLKAHRDYWYLNVVNKQYGEFCNGCGVCPFPSYAIILPTIPVLISNLSLNYFINSLKKNGGRKIVTKLYLDHIDNDQTHNHIDNFQLLCPSCNRIKNPKKIGTSIGRTRTPEMERGDKQEKEYRNYIREQIIENDWILEDDAIDGGAEYLTNFDEELTISTETVKRYLSKMVSNTGQYTRKHGYITFKWKLPQLDKAVKEAKSRKDVRIKKTQELEESYE